ncbi:MAG: hypothetical protein BroJett040_11370 [Oligoflexia bacterium]|nr:MAG: hypothetical protein BroJett040_11370 [Oligoflexia bacterium]
MKIGLFVGIMTVLLSLTGCLTTSYGTRVRMDEREEAKLNEACSQISQIGDIQSLIFQFRSDVEEVLRLSGSNEPTQHLARISELSDEIESLVLRIKSLIRQEWTDARMSYAVKWVLGLKEFGIMPDAYPIHLDFNQVKVRSVIVNGQVQDELKSQVVSRIEENKLFLTLNRKVSVLEACTLSSAMGVLVDVRYSISGIDMSQASGVGYRSFRLLVGK